MRFINRADRPLRISGLFLRSVEAAGCNPGRRAAPVQKTDSSGMPTKGRDFSPAKAAGTFQGQGPVLSQPGVKPQVWGVGKSEG